MRLKIRCNGECEKFCKIFFKLNWTWESVWEVDPATRQSERNSALTVWGRLRVPAAYSVPPLVTAGDRDWHGILLPVVAKRRDTFMSLG